MTQTISHLPSEPISQSHDVFISYSRKDQAFVRSLDAEFRKLNRSPWVDWDSIRKGEEWWAAIQHGIEGANTFVFVISPDSIDSPICQDEINYAASNNKRFLPIVYREGFDPSKVHPEISSHNWLFFRDTDDFQSAFQELLKANRYRFRICPNAHPIVSSSDRMARKIQRFELSAARQRSRRSRTMGD